MSRAFGERLKTVSTLGTPGVYRAVNSWVDGPPALGHRRTVLLTGTVVSTKMQKTMGVEVSQFVLQSRLKKWVRRSSRVLVHDEWEEARWGDVVEVRECRPLSRRKRFVLHRIVKPRHQVDWAAQAPQPLTFRTIAQQIREATAGEQQQQQGREGEERGREGEAADGQRAAVRQRLWDKEEEYAAYKARKQSYDSYRKKMETLLVARK